MAKTRELTPMQEAFLDALFGEADLDYNKAKQIAGYAPSVPIKSIVSSLKDEITELARFEIAMNAPKAARSMVGVMNDPVMLGAKERLRACEQILDRAGVIKTERIEVDTGGSAVILLPPKN